MLEILLIKISILVRVRRTGGQDEVRAIYRGVSTAIRFDISPPLRVLAANGSPDQRESRRNANRGTIV
jgi:hypothetical protein